MTVTILEPDNPCGLYILDAEIGDGKVPIPCPDTLTWARWFEEFIYRRIVAKTEVGVLLVSTVFLAIDHNFVRQGPPILFETMVFEDRGAGKCRSEFGSYTTRGVTWEDAYWTHKEVVAKVEADTGAIASAQSAKVELAS